MREPRVTRRVGFSRARVEGPRHKAAVCERAGGDTLRASENPEPRQDPRCLNSNLRLDR